jgi:predicted HD superfamily hydrolase involved in NAD metabolism
MVLLLRTPRADEFVALVKERLKKRTARHSISVAEFMVGIAETVGVSEDQCVYAGLLHDLGKGMDDGELMDAAAQCGLPVSDLQRKRPKLLHGPVAAEIARRELGIVDEAIYEAIYWHTTGRPGLGPLGLALYFADFAEPCRDHPEAEKARALFESEGFDEAVWYVSCQKLGYIKTKPLVDPITEEFHAWLEAERA